MTQQMIGIARGEQPPGRPLELTLTGKTATSILLRWDAPTNGTAVAAYQVYRDGQLVGVTPAPPFLCSNLVENTAYTFRVRARDAQGGLSDPSNALLATATTNGAAPPARVRTEYRAVVLNYNPRVLINGNYVRASDQYGHRDVAKLVAQYTRLMRLASGGQVNWTVTRQHDLDEFPQPANPGTQAFTSENYQSLRDQGYDYWNRGGPDYLGLAHDARFQILSQVNAGDLDAVWVFGMPGTGFFETAMVGPAPYWINGGAIQDNTLTRNVVLYGFGKEAHQGVGFMCENTAHMTEVMLRDRIAAAWPASFSTRVFNTLNLENPARALGPRAVNAWTRFTQGEAASWDPMLVAPGQSVAGLSHFAPTALYNYNWSTARFAGHEGDPGTYRYYDGAWSTDNNAQHVRAAPQAKLVLFDDMGMSDNLGSYHPPIAFSDADLEFTVRLLNDESSARAGLLFRVNRCQAGVNQAQGYGVTLSAGADEVAVARLDNRRTVLAQASRTLATNVPYRLRLELRGPEIKVFLDKDLEPVVTATDATYLTGGFGYVADACEAYFSDLFLVPHCRNHADLWYAYPAVEGAPRDLSPFEWNGDREDAMDQFYAWWWEHLPKNGGGHYATDLRTGGRQLLLNTWWPYILDHPRFASTVPFADLVFPPEDVTPPSAPAGLEGIPLGASQIALAWDEAADNIGVTRYAVYRNGELLRKTPSPFFTDTRLRPGTDYAYAVKACDGSGNTSPTAATVNVRTLAAEPQGALVNGRFEVNPQASAWITDAYRPSAVTYTWEGRGEGRRGTRCVALNASELNDARWARTVTGLVPGATYWVSGWVRGENIVLEPGRSVGASVCLMGTWDHTSETLAGTFEWRQVSLRFTAPPSGSVMIGCRLGYWGNLASGKAWFDDLMITSTAQVRLEEPRVTPDLQVQFLLLAEPQRSYVVESTPDFLRWRRVRSLTNQHPVVEISDPFLPAASRLFYRARRL